MKNPQLPEVGLSQRTDTAVDYKGGLAESQSKKIHAHCLISIETLLIFNKSLSNVSWKVRYSELVQKDANADNNMWVQC